MYNHFGSKLDKICQTLKQIKNDEPKWKVLVFCQWENLEKKIAQSFDYYNFNYKRLPRNIYQQNRILQSFQNNEATEFGESPEILLMSFETKWSGWNLYA